MSAPKPGDPRAPRFSTEDLADLQTRYEAILAAPADTLAEEADQLSRAHALLANALQGGGA
ncbi:hypothetical protein JKI95_01035 [Corynebacterium aquatimens]|nr:hypothetical protein JKI95_01035 [Corynebacterium aquatimens]